MYIYIYIYNAYHICNLRSKKEAIPRLKTEELKELLIL